MYLTESLGLTADVLDAANWILTPQGSNIIQNNKVNVQDNNIFGNLVSIKLYQPPSTKQSNVSSSPSHLASGKYGSSSSGIATGGAQQATDDMYLVCDKEEEGGVKLMSLADFTTLNQSALSSAGVIPQASQSQFPLPSSESTTASMSTTLCWDIFPEDVTHLKPDFVPDFLCHDDVLNSVFT